ncbi:MAG: YezD family protein [Isosphaeraceae bacterium]
MENKTSAACDASRPGRSPSEEGFGLEHVSKALKGIRYGEVRVVVQDGVIVQIERVEKQRLR